MLVLDVALIPVRAYVLYLYVHKVFNVCPLGELGEVFNPLYS